MENTSSKIQGKKVAREIPFLNSHTFAKEFNDSTKQFMVTYFKTAHKK